MFDIDYYGKEKVGDLVDFLSSHIGRNAYDEWLESVEECEDCEDDDWDEEDDGYCEVCGDYHCDLDDEDEDDYWDEDEDDEDEEDCGNSYWDTYKDVEDETPAPAALAFDEGDLVADIVEDVRKGTYDLLTVYALYPDYIYNAVKTGLNL